jgi:hypothetical protein
MDSQGCDIVVGDAHRDGKRLVVRADEKLTAFLELESATSTDEVGLTCTRNCEPTAACQARTYIKIR